MDKLKLAHEYAMEMAKQGIPLKSCKELGWKYADAMQAEADERVSKERPDFLKEEWQPDWSQAPEWANYIAVYSDYCNASYFEKEPKIINGYTWGGTDGKSLLTPIPIYTGNWKESLRKRPEALFEVNWSQAPETAIGWKMQSKSNAVWIHNKSLSAFEYSIAPTFNYQGNWQDSLRKRPQ